MPQRLQGGGGEQGVQRRLSRQHDVRAGAADPNGCPGANVVLTGQPSLHALLADPALQALRQRVRLRQPLLPLTSAETAQYVGYRLERAGGAPTELLSPASLDALHTYSAGVPRVLNNLCESALTLAATPTRTDC